MDEWIESVTVLFEDGTRGGDNDSRKALVELLGRVRGVAKVVPSGEVGAGHLQWRELAEALGVEAHEENAHEIACRNAAIAGRELERATRLVDAFVKVATKEQMKELAPLWLAPTWQDRQAQIIDDQAKKRAAVLAKLTIEDCAVLGV